MLVVARKFSPWMTAFKRMYEIGRDPLRVP